MLASLSPMLLSVQDILYEGTIPKAVVPAEQSYLNSKLFQQPTGYCTWFDPIPVLCLAA